MKASPASNMDVKRRNRANTLRCILSCERISQMELSQQLNLSWPTILQNVKELAELGFVQEVGQYESTGGRKAKAYAPVKDAKLAIGLDLTRNHVSVVLVDLSGQVVRYQRRSKPFSLEDAYLQEFVEKYMTAATSDRSIPAENIAVTTHFFKCSIVGLLLDWLDAGMDYDALSLSQQICALFGGSAKSALSRRTG